MKHLSFSGEEIIETIQMVRMEQLDIRTVTVGISLLDCVSDDPKALAKNILAKITSTARDLRQVCSDISIEFGIPIVNCRIAVTPISMIAGKCNPDQLLDIAKVMDRAAREVNVDFIGGFSALVEKGTTPADSKLIDVVPQALASTERVCASVNIGSTKAGLNMDAIARMGHVMRETAERTADRDSIGCAKLVVFCNAVQDNPFMAGAFHGVGEGDCTVNVGVSGPGVVLRTIKAMGDVDFGQLTASSARRPSRSPGRGARRPHRRHPARHSLRHRRSLPGADPGGRRQRRAHPGSDRR